MHAAHLQQRLAAHHVQLHIGRVDLFQVVNRSVSICIQICINKAPS
jgi:hypothetical protein